MSETTQTDARSDQMKRTMAEHFEEMEADYRSDLVDADVVHEDDQVVVVADHTGHELNEWADDFDVGRSELSETMHALARQVCDYSWSVSDPVVFDKLENSQ